MIVDRSEGILTLTKIICGIIQQSLKMWYSIHKPDAEKEEEDGDVDNDEEDDDVDMFYEERTGDGNVTFSDKLPPTLLNHAKMMAIESIPQRLLICKYEFVENSAI